MSRPDGRKLKSSEGAGIAKTTRTRLAGDRYTRSRSAETVPCDIRREMLDKIAIRVIIPL
jgi:hypothetical protein